MEFYNHSQRYGGINPINAKGQLKSHQSIFFFYQMFKLYLLDTNIYIKSI